MALSDKDKRVIVALARQNFWVKRCRKGGCPDSIGSIADKVWAELERRQVTAEGYSLPADRANLVTACESDLRLARDYRELVSFIPSWLILIVVKIIISIIIDYWFTSEGWNA